MFVFFQQNMASAEKITEGLYIGDIEISGVKNARFNFVVANNVIYGFTNLKYPWTALAGSLWDGLTGYLKDLAVDDSNFIFTNAGDYLKYELNDENGNPVAFGKAKRVKSDLKSSHKGLYVGCDRFTNSCSNSCNGEVVIIAEDGSAYLGALYSIYGKHNGSYISLAGIIGQVQEDGLFVTNPQIHYPKGTVKRISLEFANEYLTIKANPKYTDLRDIKFLKVDKNPCSSFQ
jgi:hypothetical protein